MEMPEDFEGALEDIEKDGEKGEESEESEGGLIIFCYALHNYIIYMYMYMYICTPGVVPVITNRQLALTNFEPKFAGQAIATSLLLRCPGSKTKWVGSHNHPVWQLAGNAFQNC